MWVRVPPLPPIKGHKKMESIGRQITVYYLDENNKSRKHTLQFETVNSAEQIENLLTRGLQFFCGTTYKSTVIPPHRITKITY